MVKKNYLSGCTASRSRARSFLVQIVILICNTTLILFRVLGLMRYLRRTEGAGIEVDPNISACLRYHFYPPHHLFSGLVVAAPQLNLLMNKNEISQKKPLDTSSNCASHLTDCAAGMN